MKFVQKENFEPKIKPMIENLQNKLYQLENKQKMLNFVLILCRSWSAKKVPKLSSEYLKHRICKFKQHLIFDKKPKYSKNIIKSAKKIMKNSTPSKLPQLLLLNFLAKSLT